MTTAIELTVGQQYEIYESAEYEKLENECMKNKKNCGMLLAQVYPENGHMKLYCIDRKLGQEINKILRRYNAKNNKS